MTTETGLIIAIIAGYPAAYAAGYYTRMRDRVNRLAKLRNELQDSRAAYLARLDEHRRKWRAWTDESMRETQTNEGELK